MKLKNLSEGEQFIVKWQYRMLGHFNTALVDAIAKADIINRTRLARGFPEEVQAYINYSENSGWWESIKQKAEITMP